MSDNLGWAVLLNGVVLSGGDTAEWTTLAESAACSAVLPEKALGDLTLPPDGLGLPARRTEDVSFPQRDGVKMYNDWYEPRIITLENVIVKPDGCPYCPSAREKVQLIEQAWNRHCGEVELVVFTDCHGTEPPTGGTGKVTGPFGVVGRPRVAEHTWLPGRSKAARMLLRFDAVDHLMYILDECGTPGSGTVCENLTPATLTLLRCYTEGSGTERCYPRCYTVSSGSAGGPEILTNVGTECMPLTITLNGTLNDPFVENTTTGERLDYDGLITGSPVIIDTTTGTATQGGQPRTHLLSGDIRMTVAPGANTLRLGSFSTGDNGTADVCFRPAVVSA